MWKFRQESAVAWFVLILVSIAVGQSSPQKQEQNLPSSKTLQLPVPGAPQRTNSFPTAVALSPDGKYLAILNNGRGAAQSKFQQSIALLDLGSNQLRDFPDARLGVDAKQTYFLGLAWSSDGSELYASIASLTDPEGKTSRRHRQWNRGVSGAGGSAESGAFSQVTVGAARQRTAFRLSR